MARGVFRVKLTRTGPRLPLAGPAGARGRVKAEARSHLVCEGVEGAAAALGGAQAGEALAGHEIPHAVEIRP
eukprot:1225379-Rhodomonas_salina.1